MLGRFSAALVVIDFGGGLHLQLQKRNLRQIANETKIG
jgi:hypothetical protein